MMRKRVGGILLAASVVAGVAVGVAASAMTSDEPTSTSGRTAPPEPVAPARNDVEVRDPVLVMNDDGTATLSATVINHMAMALDIRDATNGRAAYDGSTMLLRRPSEQVALEPGQRTQIGGLGDVYRARLRDQVQVGSTQPITLGFTGHDTYAWDLPDTTFVAPVVARTVRHADVANNTPNTDITLHDPVIVVVPGQRKAYVDGWFESTIDDMTDARPTVDPRLGQGLQLLHQTATGGPSGFFARAGKTSRLGHRPYLDTDPPGDADYVLASEVSVGQTVTITFRFPSGDVVGRFKVVQGAADGTIAG